VIERIEHDGGVGRPGDGYRTALDRLGKHEAHTLLDVIDDEFSAGRRPGVDRYEPASVGTCRNVLEEAEGKPTAGLERLGILKPGERVVPRIEPSGTETVAELKNRAGKEGFDRLGIKRQLFGFERVHVLADEGTILAVTGNARHYGKKNFIPGIYVGAAERHFGKEGRGDKRADCEYGDFSHGLRPCMVREYCSRQ
jgi:hypothetical protein